MNKELEDKTRTEVKAEVCALIDENWDEIARARDAATIEAGKQGGEKKFTYPVSLKFMQTPRGNECDLSASIAFGVRHTDETEPVTVDDHPQLPGMGDGEDDTHTEED